MVKELGKLSIDQAKVILGLIPQIEAQWVELSGLLKDEPAKVERVLTPPYAWAGAYQFSFLELASLVVVLLGAKDRVQVAVKKQDPQQAIIDDLIHGDPPAEGLPDLGVPPAVHVNSVFGALRALVVSISAIKHYGIPMDILVDRARTDDVWLFKAVRMDRSALACPPIADRLAKAELLEDAGFFRKLKNALAGPPSKPSDEYGVLRYALCLIDEACGLDSMTRTERADLFCEQLGLYPYENNDAEKSLEQFIRRWKKSRTT